MHDAVAVASLLRPELMQTRELYVEAETRGEYCRGTTLGSKHRAPNALVNVGIDREGFADLLVEAVAAYGEEA